MNRVIRGIIMIPLSSKSSFKPAPPGAHHGRCVRIIDLGTQTSERWKKSQRKILFGFELPEVLIQEGEAKGKPHLLLQRMTASLAPKGKLRPFIEGWFGKQIGGAEQEVELANNLHRLLGRFALLVVVHDETGEYANITSAAPPMAGFNKAAYPQVNESLYLSLDPASFDRSVFDKLPDGIKAIIMQSPEWRVLTGGVDPHVTTDSTGGGVDDDDAPPF